MNLSQFIGQFNNNKNQATRQNQTATAPVGSLNTNKTDLNHLNKINRCYLTTFWLINQIVADDLLEIAQNFRNVFAFELAIHNDGWNEEQFWFE